MLLLILAAITTGAAALALVIFAGAPSDNPRHHRRDEQRLPMPCTCGVRRFCGGGCAAVVRDVHSAGNRL